MIQAELDFIRTMTRRFYTGGMALDVGASGTAFRQRPKFRYDLSHMFETGAYVAFDKKRAPGVDVVGDAEKLSSYFEAGRVGCIICTSLLEHVLRPWQVIDECATVLRPGGLVVFSAPWVYEEHPDPIDCWRINVPAMRAMAGLWFNEIACTKLAVPENKIIVTMYAGRRKGDE